MWGSQMADKTVFTNTRDDNTRDDNTRDDNTRDGDTRDEIFISIPGNRLDRKFIFFAASIDGT